MINSSAMFITIVRKVVCDYPTVALSKDIGSEARTFNCATNDTVLYICVQIRIDEDELVITGLVNVKPCQQSAGTLPRSATRLAPIFQLARPTCAPAGQCHRLPQ